MKFPTTSSTRSKTPSERGSPVPGSSAKIRGLLVKDLLTLPVVANPKDPLRTLMASMAAPSVQFLPVVDDGRVVGLITSREVARAANSCLKAVAEGHAWAAADDLTAQDIMRHRVPIVASDVPLLAAIDIMARARQVGVVVADEGVFKGVVTHQALLTLAMESLDLHGRVTMKIKAVSASERRDH